MSAARAIGVGTARGAAVPRQTTDRLYMPELDLLRCIAFAMVFCGHALPPTPGWRTVTALRDSCSAGVPLFFVLSAYLITELLSRETVANGSIDLGRFYIRRILRIWPAYFLVLLGGTLISHFTAPPAIPAAALLSYSLLVGNWYTIAHWQNALHGYLPLGLGSLWSTGIQEQFYVFWPLLFVLFRSRRALLIASVAVWIVSQAVVIRLCLAHAQIDTVVWANSFTNFQYFALGSIASIVLKGSRPQLKGPVRVALVATAFAIFYFSNYVLHTHTDVNASIALAYPGYLVTGAGTLLVFFGLLGIAPTKTSAPAIWLGKISFGLYLYHLPCIVFSLALAAHVFALHHDKFVFSFVVALPLTVALSTLSYRFIEGPILRLKGRLEIVKTGAIFAPARGGG